MWRAIITIEDEKSKNGHTVLSASEDALSTDVLQGRLKMMKHTLFHEIEDLKKIKDWCDRQAEIYLVDSEKMYWGGMRVMRSYFVISTEKANFVYRLQFPNHSACRDNPWD